MVCAEIAAAAVSSDSPAKAERPSRPRLDPENDEALAVDAQVLRTRA